MAKSKTAKQAVMEIETLDTISPEWRSIVAGFLSAETYKDAANEALQQHQEAILGKADDKGELPKVSLSARFVELARSCKTEAKFNEAWLAISAQVKAGFTLDGEQVGHTKIPQSLKDAASICRKALRNNVIDKADNTGSLKALNKKVSEAKSAENPESLQDFIHLITEAYKADVTTDKDGNEVGGAVQAYIMDAVKDLADKVSKANQSALPIKPTKIPQAKVKKATK